jgi:crossover junction endodeoxyribonuclease RuvC
MRVLGIDPGSETTGWGVVEGDARRYALVDFGTLRASPRERFAARLLKIGVGVERLIEKFRPDVCAVEEAFFAVNPKTALKLGHVRGVVLLAAERAGVEIAEYAPRLVKQTVVGYGAGAGDDARAPEAEGRARARRRLGRAGGRRHAPAPRGHAATREGEG